jgi:hypothetical protein
VEIRRPSVSRDTRALLITMLVSVTALWGLARLRFPERPMGPNPVPPVLAQLAPASPLESFAGAVRDLEPKVLPTLVVLSGNGEDRDSAIGLRLPDGLVATFADVATWEQEAGRLIARNAATGLSIFPAPASEFPTVRRPWTHWTPNPSARFLLAAESSRDRLFLRPVFIGSFRAMFWPPWGTEVWALPPDAEIKPGQFLFTTEGSFAGAAVSIGGGAALVPAHALTSAAVQLAAERPEPPGYLGVAVQPLTPSLREALRAKSGVVVTWVDPDGPAAGRLRSTDVVEQFNQARPDDQSAWDTVAAHVTAGSDVRLTIRRGDAVQDVTVRAAEGRRVPQPRSSGLTLSAKPGAGAEVVDIEHGSPAEHAGFQAGDIVTRIADRQAPSPAVVTRVLAATPNGAYAVFVVRRGNTHKVLALERTW